MQLVKLGGSLITVKGKYDKKKKVLPPKIFLEDNVMQVAKELKGYEKELMLVHGAGSYGHPKAKMYGLDRSYSATPRKRMGASEVAQDVRELNHRVLTVLRESGIYSMPVPPASTVVNRNGRISRIDLSLFESYLVQGLIPVAFGDLCPDTKRGISICSGDDIMYELAKAFGAKRVIFAMDEAGVFDKDPKVHDDAKLYHFMSDRTIREWKKGMKSEDATGGIVGKVEMCKKISKLGAEVMILDGSVKGLLKKALAGKKVKGTYF